ncbi:alpha/beta hydrolase [Ornithinimicrobium sp. W1679]|uniref:alpha/beta hydrolase n=1 Tax=Ornithinimicrobium sp. W1679 TaxID=3418770 RepID=UPI003CF591BB
MSTVAPPRSERAGRSGRTRHGWARRLLVVVGVLALLLVLLFFVGGGWYFAGAIHSDGLEVKQTPNPYEHEVVATGEGSITLTDPDVGDSALDGDHVWGVRWAQGDGELATEAGFGQLRGDGTGEEEVTRSLEVLSGVDPQVGDVAALDRDAFPKDPAVALGEPVQEVEYVGPDGRFPAWYVPGEVSTWAVLVHGKGVDRAEVLRLMRSTVEAGLPSLAITYRNDVGAPQDAGGMYQFGLTEWADLDAAVAYAQDNGAQQVVLVANSMGGAVTAAYLENAPDAPVVAVVMDSPMLDFGESVSLGAAQRQLPVLGQVPEPLTWSAKRIATLRYGVDWAGMDYLDDTSWLDVPTLVLHGTADARNPLRVSEQLAQDRPDLVELVVVPEAVHVGSWNADPDTYEAEVTDFLRAQTSG